MGSPHRAGGKWGVALGNCNQSGGGVEVEYR